MLHLSANKGNLKVKLEGILNNYNYVYRFLELHFIFCREQNINPIELPHSRRYIELNDIISKGLLYKGPNINKLKSQAALLTQLYAKIKNLYEIENVDKLNAKYNLDKLKDFIYRSTAITKNIQKIYKFDHNITLVEYVRQIKSQLSDICEMQLITSKETQYPLQSILSISFKKIETFISSAEYDKFSIASYYWIFLYLYFTGWMKQNGYTNNGL